MIIVLTLYATTSMTIPEFIKYKRNQFLQEGKDIEIADCKYRFEESTVYN